MSIKFVNLDNLIEIILKILKTDNLKPNRVPNANRKTDNFWAKVCTEFYGKYDFVRTLNLFTWWKRNVEGLFDKCCEKYFNDTKTVKKKDLSISNFSNFETPSQVLLIEIPASDWLLLKRCLKQRQRLLADFHNFLSKKLQDNGLNCWLRCDFNWFCSNKSKKSTSKYWCGTYHCIVNECKIILKAFVEDPIVDVEQKVRINVFFFGKCTHEKKTLIQLSKEQKEQLGYKLKAEGVSNTIVNHILLNRQNNNDPSNFN